MQMRATTAGTGRRARLAAVGGILAILASLTISACTSGSSGALPTPSSSSSVSPSATASPSPSTSASASPSPTSSASPSPTPSPTVPAPSPSPYPTVAPATGGGGTAGFQHGLLFGLGVAAIVAGAVTIIYRRRFAKSR